MNRRSLLAGLLGLPIAAPAIAKDLVSPPPTARWRISPQGPFLSDGLPMDIGESGATRPRNIYISGPVSGRMGCTGPNLNQIPKTWKFT